MIRLLTFLRSVWRNRHNLPDQPRFLTYIVTFACNARCVMCDSWRKTGYNDLALTLPEIGRIFDQLPNMDVVRLSGGEPFLRKDLPEIAEMVQTRLKPLVFHVTSNGFLTDRIIDFCERRPKSMPLHLLISVDGVGEKHNRIRGTANGWQSVMKTLHLLAPRQKELSLQLAVNQTIIDAEGLTHYRELRDILQQLGIKNQAVMAYDLSATYHTNTEIEAAPTQPGSFTPYGEFSRNQLEELFGCLAADLTTYPLLTRLAKTYYLKGMSGRMLRNGSLPNPKCVALSSHMRLYPDGRIPTCQFNSKTIGQIRSTSFQHIWQGKQAADLRRWVRNCPGCWAECEVLPNAMYSGEIFRSVF
jgi:MoaA/NifB/PqqE/SkfB family radical SAM enzyme